MHSPVELIPIRSSFCPTCHPRGDLTDHIPPLLWRTFFLPRQKERKNNRLRDFVAVAGPLGVTHFVVLSRTDHGTNLRIARVPRGPTLSFQVKTFSLAKDIAAMQKTPKSPGFEFQVAPLLVLNNFGDSKELKLMSTVFQNMFPPINIQAVSFCCCLLHYYSPQLDREGPPN